MILKIISKFFYAKANGFGAMISKVFKALVLWEAIQSRREILAIERNAEKLQWKHALRLQ